MLQVARWASGPPVGEVLGCWTASWEVHQAHAGELPGADLRAWHSSDPLSPFCVL